MKEIVDSHVHVSLLPFEGWENMSLAGVRKVIGCSLFFGAKHAETLFDHFHQMLTLSMSIAAKMVLNFTSPLEFTQWEYRTIGPE